MYWACLFNSLTIIIGITIFMYLTHLHPINIRWRTIAIIVIRQFNVLSPLRHYVESLLSARWYYEPEPVRTVSNQSVERGSFSNFFYQAYEWSFTFNVSCENRWKLMFLSKISVCYRRTDRTSDIYIYIYNT